MLKQNMSKCNCSVDSKCGENCIDRICFVECDPKNCACNAGCANKVIQKKISIPVEVFITSGKGWGLKTMTNVKLGAFIIEYVGDVVTENEYKHRVETQYSMDIHHYALYLENGYVIDSRNMGNESWFINHSCNPNCIVQKWSVKSLLCIAIFARRYIPSGEELTIDYNFQSYNVREELNCKCKENNCRSIIGKKVALADEKLKTLRKVLQPKSSTISIESDRTEFSSDTSSEDEVRGFSPLEVRI